MKADKPEKVSKWELGWVIVGGIVGTASMLKYALDAGEDDAGHLMMRGFTGLLLGFLFGGLLGRITHPRKKE